MVALEVRANRTSYLGAQAAVALRSPSFELVALRWCHLARKAVRVEQAADSGATFTLWCSPNFEDPTRRRSWPYEPTNLENLARKSGLDGELLREYLALAIERRLRENGR